MYRLLRLCLLRLCYYAVPTTSAQDTPVPTTLKQLIENIRNILSPSAAATEEQLEIPMNLIQNWIVDSRSSIQ